MNTGLIEVPMGTTIREVVFDIGGGIRDGKKFKACLLYTSCKGEIPYNCINKKALGLA